MAPGSDRVIFTPWLNGERTPVDDTTVRGGFHNMSTTTDLRHMVRSVLEGVALNTRWAAGYVEKFVGRRLEPIRMVGGGAQSEVWCQIFADVLDRKIARVVDPMQANARGAALVGSVGMGWIDAEQIPELVGCDRVFEPDPASRAVYDHLFDAFVGIYRANRSVYARLNRR